MYLRNKSWKPECAGFSKSFLVDGEFLEKGGDWTCHRHVPEHHRRESERGVSPLFVGGGVRGNFEILDGNLGIYLRKMKLLIGLKNFCSSQREIKEIQATVKLPQN